MAIGGGLLCLLLLAIGLASLLGLLRPKSTTAADYTTAEVQEIIRLLREDPECRDTRLRDYFSLDNNSLELWEKVLGKPTSVVGRKNSPDWTFTTQDGAISVHVGVDYHSGKIPFVRALSNGEASVGLQANKPVDSAALKEQILHIKRQIDPRDSLAFEKELAKKWEKERAAEEAERRRRDEEEQRRHDELSAQRKAEREAEKARRREQQRQQDAEIAERRVFLDSQRQAEREYYDLRDALPVGPEKDLLIEQHQDWVASRIEAIKSARTKDQDWKNLPLPEQGTVLETLRAGKPVPVIPIGPGRGVDDPSSAINPDEQPPKQNLAALTEKALDKPVTLTKPYAPDRYPNAPTDKICVGRAVHELGKQVGLRYDFDQSTKNTDPVCRRWVYPNIKTERFRDALEGILKPLNLTYQIHDGVIVLEQKQGKASSAKPDSTKPTIRSLSELNTAGRELGLWLSPDALRIYFEREANPTSIFMAERPDTNSPFGAAKELVPGRHPTLTADELTLIVLGESANGDGESLHVTRRTDRSQPFPKPKEIPELRSVQIPKTPYLSADGLNLVFLRAGKARGFFVSTRPNIKANWSNPRPLRIKAVSKRSRLSWPFFSEDGLTLIAADESESGAGNFFIWTRSNQHSAFSKRRKIRVPGVSEIFGRSPFYVESTGELFFSSTRPRRYSRYLDQQKNGDWNLWVVEGISVP